MLSIIVLISSVDDFSCFFNTACSFSLRDMVVVLKCSIRLMKHLTNLLTCVMYVIVKYFITSWWLYLIKNSFHFFHNSFFDSAYIIVFHSPKKVFQFFFVSNFFLQLLRTLLLMCQMHNKWFEWKKRIRTTFNKVLRIIDK